MKLFCLLAFCLYSLITVTSSFKFKTSSQGLLQADKSVLNIFADNITSVSDARSSLLHSTIFAQVNQIEKGNTANNQSTTTKQEESKVSAYLLHDLKINNGSISQSFGGLNSQKESSQN